MVEKTIDLIGRKMWGCTIVGLGEPDEERHATLLVVCHCRGKRPPKDAQLFPCAEIIFLKASLDRAAVTEYLEC